MEAGLYQLLAVVHQEGKRGQLASSVARNERAPNMAERIIVVTDSSATVPQDLARELDIRVVPLLLRFAGQTLRDGVDVTPGDIYRWQRVSKQIPTTSSPSVGDFVRAYARAAQAAPGIVSIHVARQLSATYAAALTASDLVDGVPIRVVDCGTATMAQGFAAMEAARSAAAGADLDQVAARATEIAGRTHLLAAIGTLEYLHLGGRIGGAARLVGTVLRIKPVLYLANGRVEVFAQPRTLRRAKETMLRRVSELAGLNPVHMAIFHSDALGEALDLRKQATARFECAEIYITELTPVMGAHTGAGVLGVAFYAERGASDAR